MYSPEPGLAEFPHRDQGHLPPLWIAASLNTVKISRGTRLKLY
jgi:hypothetical protein